MPVVEYPHGERFPGRVGLTTADSSPAWPEPIRAREGAPNVLFFVLDDVGYGQLSTFGGLVETPNIERVAKRGLRFSNMHTTALCSPTRSCILTGRNHHSNGVASIMETATGYPGYDARMPFENGMISEILRAEGYNTFCVGKWHLSPSEDNTAGRPLPSMADRTRLRALLRLPRRRDQPVVSGPHRGQPRGRAARDARGGLPPQRRPRRPGHQDDPGRPRERAGEAVLPVLRHRLRPRPAPRGQGVGGQVQGRIRRRLGCLSREGLRAAAGAGHPAGTRGAAIPRPRRARVVLAVRRRAAPVCAVHGGVRRIRQLHRPPLRPSPRRAGADRGAREHADHGHQR